MYRNFFSLSDLPFSIAPDPKYIFMSDRHKEALSHLTYGLGEVGGFALLTGEVGTGKTTISRCVMEQLPENTQAAFILNPMLSSQELLATLCDKLEIHYLQDEITLKNLTDKISEKLLQNHEEGINTLLIIDEAQHLQPEVLEQLRLLTNLETNTKKLLQVILIGQPELQQLLQRRDLRQLAQRITARYHLMPLTREELKQYIQHRLGIADCTREIFDKGAIHKIHQLAQGVPRLTNLLCHSALMTAYNQNDSVVNKKTVMSAAEVALGPAEITTRQGVKFNPLVMTSLFSGIAFITLAAFWWGQYHGFKPQLVNQSVNSSEQVNEREQLKTVIKADVKAEVNPEISSDLVSLPEADIAEIKPKTHQVDMPTDYAMHTVKYGDSLYSISLAYNTKISAILEWNNIENGSDLSIGDKLHVIAPKGFVANQNNRSGDNTSKPQPNESRQIVVSAEKADKKYRVQDEKISSKPSLDSDYNLQNVDGVSDDLLARFQAALDETSDEQNFNSEPTSNIPDLEGDDVAVKPLSQLPSSIQNALPAMQFEQHIYSSDGDGWVTVNGRDRYEGDYINNDLRVEEILPQQVVLSFRGEKFSMPALTNW